MTCRVVVGMSGGVDSSVVAALLVRQGYDVVGVTLDVWPQSSEVEARPDACCSLAAVEDARRVADHIGIPHYTLNFRDVFSQTVITDFIAEYRCGRTPNPCIRCNEHIKFGAMLRYARGLGATHIATGHYARLSESQGRFVLHRGVDLTKDQTYVLYSLTQEQLASSLMPLGGYTKPQTRALASELGLQVATRPDSQDICFINEGDYGGFLRQQDPGLALPGRIIDVNGVEIGKHQGIAFYTVGQRRGLGICYPKPVYVVSILPATNTIVVGPEDALWNDYLVADNLNLVSVDRIVDGQQCRAKVRYRSPEADAWLYPLTGGIVEIRFACPQRAITPGQAVVFYDGDTLLGGATIRSSGRMRAAC